jgi:hypothetical protein
MLFYEKKIQKKFSILFVLSIIILTSYVIFLNINYIRENLLINENQKNLTLIFEPGYNVKIGNKEVFIFGEDRCEPNETGWLQEPPKPKFDCIRIYPNSHDVIVHFINNYTVVTELWNIKRTTSPSGNLIISINRPDGQPISILNANQKDI